jgi:hypothetical protein
MIANVCNKLLLCIGSLRMHDDVLAALVHSPQLMTTDATAQCCFYYCWRHCAHATQLAIRGTLEREGSLSSTEQLTWFGESRRASAYTSRGVHMINTRMQSLRCACSSCCDQSAVTTTGTSTAAAASGSTTLIVLQR